MLVAEADLFCRGLDFVSVCVVQLTWKIGG
jgi:hypothetical protein